jgi:hemolysin activation/secretion protein
MRHSRPNARRLRRVLFAACGAALTASSAAVGQEAAPAKTATQTFDIEAYDVDGASVLKQLEVEKAVYPYLGPGRTRDDVDHARAALEKAYHDRGYQSVVVEIPAQPVSEIIRLHVVEAPVGRLRVTGSRYFSPEVIRRQAPSLAEGSIPDFNQTQKELADVNRLADRRVTPVLRAGVAPGTVDVDLKVSDTLPLHASVELDNDHSENTEPLRLVASTHYDNLWQLGHSVSFTYSVAPQNPANSQVFAGSYLAPLWTTPWSLLVYGYDSNSNVASLGGTDVLGKGYSVGERGIVQWPKIGPFSQSLSFGIDFKHFDQNVVLGASTTTAPITYFPLNAVYSLQSENGHGSAKVSLGLTAGVPGLGSDTAAFENARFDAQPNFVHVNLDAHLTQALGHGVELAERFSGQLADQPLVSSEQFSAGGLNSVRGYLQSEAIGDDGVFGSLELHSPSLAPLLGKYVDDLRFYGFTDGAALWVIDALHEQTSFFDLYSTGLGLRFAVLKYLKGDVAVAVPLTNGAVTLKYRPRATFSLKSEF